MVLTDGGRSVQKKWFLSFFEVEIGLKASPKTGSCAAVNSHIYTYDRSFHNQFRTLQSSADAVLSLHRADDATIYPPSLLSRSVHITSRKSAPVGGFFRVSNEGRLMLMASDTHFIASH